MATYVNNLRLKEITTGDEDGTWGTSTNTNLELIGEALGYNTQDCFASDANATTTVADGATDPARAFYFKVTSSATLTATRTLTIAPNTVSRVMFIENATTGSQSIEVSQGSGANVTIPTGETKIVYLDGAGATAAVVDALSLVDVGDGTVTSVGGTGTVNGLTLTGTVTSSGNLTLGGTLSNVDLTTQVTGTLPIANGGTGSTSTTYVDLTANVTGTLPIANGGTGLTTLGTANQVLAVNAGATALEYQNAATGSVTSVDVSGGTTGLTTSGGPITSSGTVTLAGTLGEENGGTGQTGYTTGDILYASATDTLSKLALGSADEVLKVNAGGTQVEWGTAGGGADLQEFTSTGTWTKPAGATFVKVEVWGGGGGGAGGARCTPGNPTGISSITGGNGGGGGGYFSKTFLASDLGATEPVTVGAGGSGGTGQGDISSPSPAPGVAAMQGTPGGNSYFGTSAESQGWVFASGGAKGGGEPNPANPNNRGGRGGYAQFEVTEFTNPAGQSSFVQGITNWTALTGRDAPIFGVWSGGGGGHSAGPSPLVGGTYEEDGSGSYFGGAGGGGGRVTGPVDPGGNGGSNFTDTGAGGGGAGGATPTNPSRTGAAGPSYFTGGGGGANSPSPTTSGSPGGAGNRASGGGGGGGAGSSGGTGGNGGAGGAGLVRVYTW